MFCKYCGMKIPNDSLFCTACGKSQRDLNGGRPPATNPPEQKFLLQFPAVASPAAQPVLEPEKEVWEKSSKLSRKKDTVSLILICIAGYFVICLYALTLRTLVHFAILAFGVGCFQGSIQSLSRSYYSKIIPAENSGEYFGIYDIFAKGASFLGSVVIAVVKLAGGTINVAVACLAVFFALGFVFLKIADHQPMAGEK